LMALIILNYLTNCMKLFVRQLNLYLNVQLWVPNFLNFRAHEIYTINGNKIDETFVEWDAEKKKCFAGFTVSGNNVGVDETIKVSGEALSFLSTGIDTRVYFIKNF